MSSKENARSPVLHVHATGPGKIFQSFWGAVPVWGPTPRGKGVPSGEGAAKKPPGPFPEAFGAKYENSALAELRRATSGFETVLQSSER